LFLSAAVLSTGLVATGHARAASCDPATAALTYSQQNVTAKFTLHPACAGTAVQVGTTAVHLDARRCDPFSCVLQPRRTLTCRWSRKACVYTISWPHPATERASYQFDMDYANDDKHPVVFVGADTEATSCVAVEVTYDCTI
jgi:hypothetical protein